MAFNRSDYVKVKQMYDDKRRSAKDISDMRRKQLCAAIPELNDIDKKIITLGPRIYGAALEGKDGFDSRVESIKKETEELLKIQSEILDANGYPKDYFDVKYDCPLCRDEGNINGKMCSCMKDALIKAGYVSAGIASLCQSMNFDTFDLSYYTGKDRENMEIIFKRSKEYAENFGKGSGSLLFLGGTGLGKTHISVAIAKRVIEGGNYVIYDTAQNVFSDFIYERFQRSYNDTSAIRTDKYFECDLLIIDDLGTEIGSQAVTAFLYNLINTRINGGLSTVINTNLSHKEMLSTYDERVASRLFGEFLPYMFTGKDVRMQKLG